MAINEYAVCENVRWLEILAPSQEEMEQVSKDHNLHYQLVRDCMQPDHLPKYDEVNGVNFLYSDITVLALITRWQPYRN